MCRLRQEHGSKDERHHRNGRKGSKIYVQFTMSSVDHLYQISNACASHLLDVKPEVFFLIIFGEAGPRARGRFFGHYKYFKQTGTRLVI